MTDEQPTAEEIMEKAMPAPATGKEVHRGQLRFAERFKQDYSQQFLYAHGIGWHEYDGARWAVCLDGAEHRAVHALLKSALKQLATLDEEPRKDLLRDIAKVESAAGINGVLDIAKTMYPCAVAATDLDASPHLLNTRNGTVDIVTGHTSTPRPADHLSKVTNAVFSPEARSDLFERFLERAQPDPDMRGFVARSLGSTLLGRVREHHLHIWHGDGANGKGTLRDAVRHALGDYGVEVPADILLQNKYGQAALAPERMRLKGARIAFCSEIAKGARLDEATMKKLTGGDPVNAKLLYRNPIEFPPSHTIFMLTNVLPKVSGDDPATWRRILAVPFNVVVPADERDPELNEKLEREADAILAWLWHGWLDYQKHGLNPPEAVLAATRKYQTDSDLLARFLGDEDVVCVGHGSVKSSDLYRTFTDWCRNEGEDVQMSNKAFTEAMEKRGYARKKLASGQSWPGLMLAGKDERVFGAVV